MGHNPLAGVFPLGSHLCREPMPPMAELKRDMENLRRHGFNLVKLQEHWAVDEPREGEYDFSRYEELIAHAAKLDMTVYLGLTCEQAPTWLWRKHPDCRMMGMDGLPVAYEAQATLPSDGKPGPCFDHEGARADQSRFLTKLVSALGSYENIVWNTWQEVAYWAEWIVGQPVCYCEHTVRAWRAWLQEKHGDLDALNRAWNTRYREWAYVVPQRKTKAWMAVEVEWRYFMDNVQIARVLRSRAEAIRGADPRKRPVFAHVASPTIGSGRDWTYARCQDFLGSSCYPAWSSVQEWDDARAAGGRPEREPALTAEVASGVALLYDYVRSCNRPGAPVWAAEFQGGPVSDGFHKGRVPSADDIRRWMLTAVGSGVTAISFWVTRAEIMAAEANGFSLLDSEGETTERFEEAARVGRALGQHPDLFGQPSWPGAQIAIVVDEWNHQSCQSMPHGGGHLEYSVRGWHRLLWKAGIPTDFVEMSHLDEEPAGRYRALIVPFPIALSDAAIGKLARYAERGGSVISEACPGRVTPSGFCNRGELSPKARELFGVRHESLTMVREPQGGSRWSPQERTWGEYLEDAMLEGVGPLEGLRLRANVYVETFGCEGSEPCLRHEGRTVGAVRNVGKGRAWLLGTFVGHNGTAYQDEESQALVRALLAQCGVAPAHEGRLLLRKRVGDAKEAWLFTNPSASEVAERISVAGWSQVADLLGERVAREGDSINLTVKGLDVRALVLKR